jgi:hypothetical protein
LEGFTSQYGTVSTVEEIEKAIEHLPAPQLGELRRWFDEFMADQWDARIEADARSGKLDFLLDEAEEAHRKGTVRPFNP